MSALRKEGDTDYVLEQDHDTVWITVDNISVYIIRTDEGVVVDLFPLGLEARESIAGTYAFRTEAQELIDDDSESPD